jgi:hypothetical protein
VLAACQRDPASGNEPVVAVLATAVTDAVYEARERLPIFESDENLVNRPSRFVSDENLRRLNELRDSWDLITVSCRGSVARSRMGAGDAEVDQQRGHRFGGHRRAPVGVHGVRRRPVPGDDFPGSFGSLLEARDFLDGFFTEYNHVHRHSGIGWHTAASAQCTSAPPTPSTTPGRPPSTRPGTLIPNASPAGPDHPKSRPRAGSTNPNQNYRRPELNLSHLT